jgi:hypothetical protein
VRRALERRSAHTVVRGLLSAAVMPNTLDWCASLCQGRVLRAIAVTMAVGACGGAVASSPSEGEPRDVGSSDASVPPSASCPGTNDIDTKAAIGRACASEGAYCLNPACNPCTSACPAVACTHGTWTPAINTAICTTAPDASPVLAHDSSAPTLDGGACGTLDLSSFDTSCASDSDCLAAGGGTFCTGQPVCTCPGALINVKEQARYQAELLDLESRFPPSRPGCNCPYFGRPTCVQGQCTLCGGASGVHPGCPDAW